MAPLNVRASITLTRTVPRTRELKAAQTLWWLGDRFHLRDESGRTVADILADATEARGFGALPRTMEEFMDTFTVLEGAVDVYGNRARTNGLVRVPGLPDEPIERSRRPGRSWALVKRGRRRRPTTGRHG